LGCKPASTLTKFNVDLWFDGVKFLMIQKGIEIDWKFDLTITKPDITFAVEVLSRFMHQPREVHWTATLRILTYVKSSPGKGLLYKKHGNVHISGYSDSGYAGDKGDIYH